MRILALGVRIKCRRSTALLQCGSPNVHFTPRPMAVAARRQFTHNLKQDKSYKDFLGVYAGYDKFIDIYNLVGRFCQTYFVCYSLLLLVLFGDGFVCPVHYEYRSVRQWQWLWHGRFFAPVAVALSLGQPARILATKFDLNGRLIWLRHCWFDVSVCFFSCAALTQNMVINGKPLNSDTVQLDLANARVPGSLPFTQKFTAWPQFQLHFGRIDFCFGRYYRQ